MELIAGKTGGMAGQTINDRLLAARHSIAGQGLAKSVCKATTEEMIGPKKKHLDCEPLSLISNVFRALLEIGLVQFQMRDYLENRFLGIDGSVWGHGIQSELLARLLFSGIVQVLELGFWDENKWIFWGWGNCGLSRES